jgi:hypothetical protein
MLIFIESLYHFLGGFICGYRGGRAIAPRRSYKLLSDNTKGVKACNIIIANGLELNAASCFYRCPIIYIYNLNTYPSNISK